MIKNYLKITLRNLFKNKVYVAINIVGLGLALACCIVAYLNSKFNWDFDKNHEKIDHIYKVHNLRENQGEVREYGRIPMPMAPAIRNDLPGVDRVFRFEGHAFTVRDVKMDKVFHTSVCYAEPGLLESFTFPLIAGDVSGYHELDQAVVTETYARKFYGDEDPIGKVLTVFDDTGMSFNFVVAGVVQEAPQNSSVHFELLINFENRFRMYDDNVKGNWGAFAQATFLYFDDPDQAANFAPLLDKYLEVQSAARPDFEISKFILSPMNNHAHIADNVRSDALRDAMDPAAVFTPQIMAILILLVACFNFTNTAIATSNRRLKEIGLRKVMGSNRKQLIVQFMTENLTVCFLGIVLSLGIASMLVPTYSAMWEGMDLRLDFTEDLQFYVFLVVLLVFTTVLAGLYPSLYISKYQPVNILRGSLSIGGTSRFTKVLLAAQYTFTVIAMFASIAFVQNAKYQDTLDLGFNQDQIIGVSLLNDNQYQKIQASMFANPDIEQIAVAKHHIGRDEYDLLLKHQDMEVESEMMDVGIGYIETMNLKILAGRSFDKDLEASDSKNSIIVNQKLVEAMDWTNPIGKRISINDSTKLNVIGVVQDFHIEGFWDVIEPMGIRLSSLRFEDDGTYSYIVAKTSVKNTKAVYEYLEQEWNDKIPTKVFAGFYQDEFLRESKNANSNIIKMFSFLGGVAFILSCLGLFTMVSINLIKRMKEIGVRKVLGGTIRHIIFLINSKYVILLMISSTLGITLGYLLIDGMIASIFAYYKPMNVFTFMIPMVTILAVSLAISSLRTLKSALANPVKSLRYE